MAQWRALVAEGDRSAARIVLAKVERIDAERGVQAAARRLDISPRTHGANILAKLGVHSQPQAVLFALGYGAVDVRCRAPAGARPVPLWMTAQQALARY
jgi:DNA-binding CsgD family transcriptional regulator